MEQIKIVDLASVDVAKLPIEVSTDEKYNVVGDEGPSFAKVYLNVAGDYKSNGIFLKLSQCRMKHDENGVPKIIDYKPQWNKITLPLQFNYAAKEQWLNLLAIQERIESMVKSWGGDYANIAVKRLFKVYDNVNYNTLYMKWPTHYDELGMLVGKSVSCRVDGNDGELNAVKFGEQVLPATFDIYAELRLYMMRQHTGAPITVGYYFDLKSLDCQRDPTYTPQAKIPPGVKMPPKLQNRPNPYDQK